MLGTDGHPGDPLVAKLSQFVPLAAAEVDFLEALCVPEERFKTGTNIFSEGDGPRSAFVVTRAGWHAATAYCPTGGDKS